MFSYPEVGRVNPRSQLKTYFNLDALYLSWFCFMVLIATCLPRPNQGVFEIARDYQRFNPDQPGSGAQWECGDTPVRIPAHPPGTHRGQEFQGFLSSMGSVCSGPENYFTTNEHSCPFALTRRPQQAIGWAYKAFAANRNGEEFGVTSFGGMNAALVRRE